MSNSLSTTDSTWVLFGSYRGEVPVELFIVCLLLCEDVHFLSCRGNQRGRLWVIHLFT